MGNAWREEPTRSLGMARTSSLPWREVPTSAFHETQARYQTMFGRTHSFLPMRHGISPNTLHVALHLVIVGIVVLLGVITFGGVDRAS